jgi:hypothetical protein
MVAAAQQTATSQSSFQHLTERGVTITKANATDFVILPHAGASRIVALNVTGAPDPLTGYGTATINNGGTAYSATTTSIVVASAFVDRTTTGVPYVLRTSSGEYLMVIGDSAPSNAASTLTIIRGAFGSTASATGLANSNTLEFMNILQLSTGTGITNIWYIPLPADPKAAIPNTTT